MERQRANEKEKLGKIQENNINNNNDDNYFLLKK